MARSSWKGPFFSKQIFEILQLRSSKFIFFKKKNIVILPDLVNRSVKVYNGCKFIDIKVTLDMVGHKLGEFVFTRKLHVYKKK